MLALHPKEQDVVIDLTGDNDEDPELKHALELSMASEQGPSLVPSDRAPDPNWAVVPSNVGHASIPKKYHFIVLRL